MRFLRNIFIGLFFVLLGFCSYFTLQYFLLTGGGVFATKQFSKEYLLESSEKQMREKNGSDLNGDNFFDSDDKAFDSNVLHPKKLSDDDAHRHINSLEKNVIFRIVDEFLLEHPEKIEQIVQNYLNRNSENAR